MKIKTLQDLSDNFEVLSHSEEKEILGGVNMISTSDGNIYDVVIPNLGYTSTALVDTDSSWGGSFSYIVNENGTPITINVNETDYGMGTSSWERFTLLYVGMDFDTNPTAEKLYYDNLTGYSFSANFFKEINGGAGYEDLPDLTVSDNDMGEFSGYTTFEVQLLKYLVIDELTGGYYDYSRIVSSSTHYDADYVGMTAAGYQQQAIDAQIARDNASRASANDMSELMNHLNGSKLAAAQKAWAADPVNFGKPFDFLDYAKISVAPLPTGSIIVKDWIGIGSGSLSEFYSAFKAEIEENGVKNIHSFLYHIW